MPIAVFLWFIGWSLSFGGSKKDSTKSQTKLAIPNELFMYVVSPEKKYAT